MSNQRIVVVTGASGNIGSHIVLKLLASGYNVRLLARGLKAEKLRNTIAKDNAHATVVEITDIATDDFAAAFKDAYAIIHTASPLAGQADAKSSLASALEGSLNVLRQAVKYKVKKFVMTATWASTLEPGDPTDYWTGKVITYKDWGHVTSEDVIKGTHEPFWVYCATKLLSEKASWKFAAEHPELDVASINPPFVYGPFAKGFPIPGRSEIGANGLLYQLIAGEKGGPLPYQIAPYFCDVRDVADAHVKVLNVPPAPQDIQSKRYLMCAGQFLWQDAVRVIAKEWPGVVDRLPSLDNAPAAPGPFSTTDTSQIEADLKMTEYIGWEEMVVDTFTDLIEAEAGWD